MHSNTRCLLVREITEKRDDMGIIIDSMTNLIGDEINEDKRNSPQPALTEEQLAHLYQRAKQHDLAHLVGDALIKREMLADPALYKLYKREVLVAVYRYEHFCHELNRIRETLNAAEISFIPLKGAVIRDYYPEKWMRTSGDIDLLVHESDMERAIRILTEKLGYTFKVKCDETVVMTYKEHTHVELHYSINEFDTERQTIFDDCWTYAHLVDGYEYQFENEFFLTYFYAHAAKHFAHGGCGVRPFIDCFLLNKKMPYDNEKLQAMLVGEGVDRFAEAMEKLAEVWFANGRHDAVTERMAAFVLRGGVYGSLNNTMSVRQQQEKGVHGYLLRRLCIPYATLCEFYPILRKHPYLTPLYRVRRWFRAFMPRTRASFRNDVRAISGISEKNRSDTGFLLCELGLNDFVPLE